MNTKTVFLATETRREWIRRNLHELVLQESPSEDRASVNAATAIVERLARGLGGRVRRNKQKEFGDVVELRFGPARSARKPILLLGHMDTVWPIGTDRKSVV